VKGGTWKWLRKDQNDRKQAAFAVGKRDIYMLIPVRLRYSACRLDISCGLFSQTKNFRGFVLLAVTGTETKEYLSEHRSWLGYGIITDSNFKKEVWFSGNRRLRRSLAKFVLSGKTCVVSLDEDRYPYDKLYLIMRKVKVTSISVNEVSSDELPRALQSEESWETLKESMPLYRSWWKEDTHKTVPNPLYNKGPMPGRK
jgi:hypothetical protein